MLADVDTAGYVSRDVKRTQRDRQEHGMNRRQLLAGTGALAITACSPKSDSVESYIRDAKVFSGANLMADVESYVNFGTHRTGSTGDLATTDWFTDHWATLGYAIEQTDVECPNADTHVAKLRIGDEAFDGFAQPPLVFTPEGGLSAPMVMWDAAVPAAVSGKIAVIHVPRAPNTPSPGPAYRAAVADCVKAGAKAAVLLMSGPSGEVVAINTPLKMQPSIPVLQIGEKERARVEAAMARNIPGKLIMEGPGGKRVGRNTIARFGESGPWVIISTPQSGWFTCGGERGPGIAISRALSAWAVTQKFPVRWLFIATSGHEWTDAGAEIFHHGQAPKPADTALWFHLGASFGARAYEETPNGPVAQSTPNLGRALMASPDMIPHLEAAFAGQPVIEKPLARDVKTALGEYRLVAEEGYPSSAGFWGYNAHFHTPIDGAESTTPEIMEPIARGVAKAIEARLSKL